VIDYVKPLDSLLIKPAGPDCNMACSYCFYYEKASLFPQIKKHRMSEDTLECLIKQALQQSNRQMTFSWQGGEPTLMGLDFYRKATQLQQNYGRGHVIGNGFQTNGILIDNAWAQFLRSYQFLVGLSLDGPRHIHDYYRKMRDGKGSWSKVTDTARLLLDSDVSTNALIVINDYSVNYPAEIYEFHKDLGLAHMQFIPCVETDDHNPGIAAPFSVSSDKLGPFLCRLFDLWLADFSGGIPATSIRFFDSIFYRYVDMLPPECTLLEECGVYVVVEHNGDVYSCDFFVEPDWKLGNIHQDRLIDLLNSPRQQKFGSLKSDLPQECKNCRWLGMCRGGCVKDRLRDPRDNKLNHFCRAYQMFFDYADVHFKRIAREWKIRQGFVSPPPPEQSQGKAKIGRNDPCPCGSGLKFKNCCGRQG